VPGLVDLALGIALVAGAVVLGAVLSSHVSRRQ
jgi:hypothetical protein